MFWTPSRIESDAETYSTYLDALIEHSPIAIIVLDAQHRFEMCNPAFEDLFQYGREALSSTNVDELISAPGFSNDAPRITRRVLQGHKVHAITHRRRKDGEIIEVEVYGVPLIVNRTIRGVYGPLPGHYCTQPRRKRPSAAFEPPDASAGGGAAPHRP